MAETSGSVTAAEVGAIVNALMPKPAVTAPLGEATTAQLGPDPTFYAIDKHQHPRLTSTTVAAIATGNTVALTFTRIFANEPGIVYQELPPAASTTTPVAGDTATTAQPTSGKVISWTLDGSGNYIGCTVRVYKAQTVPTNLVTLLLGGVFNIFGSTVVGTRFSLIAIARSDV